MRCIWPVERWPSREGGRVVMAVHASRRRRSRATGSRCRCAYIFTKAPAMLIDIMLAVPIQIAEEEAHEPTYCLLIEITLPEYRSRPFDRCGIELSRTRPRWSFLFWSRFECKIDASVSLKMLVQEVCSELIESSPYRCRHGRC